ncbi:hypothetical protein [Streptomyces asiaticus]|uniref:hypothetical protein n=1 Tax=Streptomyces asiaticus TaxID=114695 RepID=UPI001BAA3C14|nr:hypothetical protein [Streptomyces asiaticus]
MSAKGNAVLVEALGSSLRRTGNGLEAVPGLVKEVLLEGAWREFITPRGELVKHGRFVDFVTTPPTKGLGASVNLIKRLVEPDPEATDLLDQALQQATGRPEESVSNRNTSRPVGTTKTAALRRLRKDKPELHAEVLAGRLSAHAAMVQAGFRPKTVSVPVSRPDSIAAALRRHLSPDDIARLIKHLLDEPQTGSNQ